VTSGTGLLAPRRVGTEADEHASGPDAVPRVASEEAAAAVSARGVHVSVVRLPPTVHGAGDHGFVPALIGIARSKGVSAFIGDGLNRWPAVHRIDAAQAFTLALHRGATDARYHAVAEEGVPLKEIAATIGRHLKVRVMGVPAANAGDHFGWLAHFVALDCPASSLQTQSLLGWQPKQPTLLADLDHAYFHA
jgi:nucleoside-diphosphate-sugar epimerase